MSKTRKQNTTSDQLGPTISHTDFHELLHQQIRQAVRTVLESVMQEELNQFLGVARFVRGEGRQGQRNGYRQRDLNTVVGPIPDLQVPRDRAGAFQTQVFERFERNEAAVSEAIAQMWIGGVSQSKVAAVTEPLMGLAPSASSVSRIAHDLEADCEAWRRRPLADHYRVVYIDGVYYPILHEQKRDQTALLVVLGVDMSGDKAVLAVQVGGVESRAAYDNLMTDLKARGVSQIDLLVSDGDAGLIGAFEAAYPVAARQRCLTHKYRNVLAHIPLRKKKEVAAALKGVFEQPAVEAARTHLAAFKLRYERDYPEAVRSLEEDQAACLTYYQFAGEMQKHIRTSNALEGLFSTIRRRTNSMGVFQNENSCVLIVYAVICSVKFRRIPVV